MKASAYEQFQKKRKSRKMRERSRKLRNEREREREKNERNFDSIPENSFHTLHLCPQSGLYTTRLS